MGFRSQSAQLQLFQQIISSIEESVGVEQYMDTYEGIVDMFHAQLSDAKKTAILDDYKSADSTIRIVISTIAFGMGVNIPDVRRVLHWGLSADTVSYLQEIGRAGRDGLPATAFLVTAPHCKSSDTLRKMWVERKKHCVRMSLLTECQVGNISQDTLMACCGGEDCCSTCNTKKCLP